MMPSNVTLGARIDALAADIAGLVEGVTSQVSSYRAAREEAAPSAVRNYAHKLVRAIERHPVVAIVTAVGVASVGIAVVTARALRRR